MQYEYKSEKLSFYVKFIRDLRDGLCPVFPTFSYTCAKNILNKVYSLQLHTYLLLSHTNHYYFLQQLLQDIFRHWLCTSCLVPYSGPSGEDQCTGYITCVYQWGQNRDSIFFDPLLLKALKTWGWSKVFLEQHGKNNFCKKKIEKISCLQYGGRIEEPSPRTKAENKELLMWLVPLFGSTLTSLPKHRTEGG